MIQSLLFLLAISTANAFDTPFPVIAADYKPKVILEAVDGFSTKEEKALISSAQDKMNVVVQGDCFKNFISSRSMIQTNGKSSSQVADHLQSLDGVVKIKMYERCMTWSLAHCLKPTSAVAYTDGSGTSLNRVYFSSSQPVCQWASTLGHEVLGHFLGGYSHAFRWDKTRDFSVPYSINAAFSSCCK
jgi:hypothetical protein